MGVYAVDSSSVAADVHAWAIEHGDDPNIRIVACGYEGEADYPESWRCIQWNPGKGYGASAKTRTNTNYLKERLWLSPHCMDISSNATNHNNNQTTLEY